MVFAVVGNPDQRRFRGRGTALAGMTLAGLIALVWALSYGTQPGTLDRIGPVFLWALPVAKMVFNVAAAGAIGALVLIVFGLSPGEPAGRKALRFAGYSAAVWAGAGCVVSVTNFQIIANLPLFAEGFAQEYFAFVGIVGPGESGAVSILIAAAVSVLSFLVKGTRTIALNAMLAFGGLIPLVLDSHAASGADHADNTGSVILHIGAAAVWLGGLLTLVWTKPSLSSDRLPIIVRRYSTLALLAFLILVSSGLFTAAADIASPAELNSPYGAIVLLKGVSLLMLGIFGMLHRLRVIEGLERDPDRGGRRFTFLVVAELTVMGAASGLAAALARTEPPTSAETVATDTSVPAPELWSAVTQWQLDPVWSVLSAVGIFFYLAGVRRLRQAGGYWPAHRILLWVTGVALLFTVTNGGLHVYQGYLFSAHVLTQMLLIGVVPVFLVVAAPVKLALTSIQPRADGSMGGLELARSVQSLNRACIDAPYVAVLILAGSLISFYYTPLLELSAAGQLGYIVMTVLALFSGCVFVSTVISPTTGEAQRWLHGRLGALAGAAILYAVYGNALISGASELQRPWNNSDVTFWDQTPLTGTEQGGLTMWIIGGATLITLAVIVIHRQNRTGSLTLAAQQSEASNA